MAHVATIHIAIAYFDERIEIYLAKGLRQEGAKLDDEEFLEVFTLPLATRSHWVREGKSPTRKPCPACSGAEKVLSGEWSTPLANLQKRSAAPSRIRACSSPARPPREHAVSTPANCCVGIPDVPVMRPRADRPVVLFQHEARRGDRRPFSCSFGDVDVAEAGVAQLRHLPALQKHVRFHRRSENHGSPDDAHVNPAGA